MYLCTDIKSLSQKRLQLEYVYTCALYVFFHFNFLLLNLVTTVNSHQYVDQSSSKRECLVIIGDNFC